jgi:hypothetical protein
MAFALVTPAAPVAQASAAAPTPDHHRTHLSVSATLAELASLDRAGVRALLDRTPGLIATLLTQTSAADAAIWWAEMDAARRDDLIRTVPVLVGSLDGIDAADRVRANRYAARARLARVDERLQQVSRRGAEGDAALEGERERAGDLPRPQGGRRPQHDDGVARGQSCGADGEAAHARLALAAELPASKLSRRGKVALWGCGALMLGGSSVAAAMPPLAFLTSFLGAPAFLMVRGGITAFHAIMGDFSIASPAFQQFDKAGRLKNETAARTTLEDLRRSSQIDAVLTAYPALKERFAEEATRAAIKGQVAAALPAPEARVMPQKSAVPLRRNIEV